MTFDYGDFYMTNGRIFFVPSLSYIRSHRTYDFKDMIQKSLSKDSFEGFLDVLSLRNSSLVHANSFYFQKGRLLDLNSKSHCIDEVFFFSTNNILATFNPQFFVDLHESKGNECFLYVGCDNSIAISIATKIVELLILRKVPIRDSAKDRVRLNKGIFALESFVDYGFQCKEYPVEIIFETGIDTTIECRVSWMNIFVQSFFETLSGYEL